MSVGPLQIAIIVIILILLFGRGKISSLLGDLAQGIKAFKKGMADDDKPAETPRIDSPPTQNAQRVDAADGEKDTAAKG